jgi:hypothetical protein
LCSAQRSAAKDASQLPAIGSCFALKRALADLDVDFCSTSPETASARDGARQDLARALARLDRAVFEFAEGAIEALVQRCRALVFPSLHKGARGWSWQRAESLFSNSRPSAAVLAWNLFLRGLAVDMAPLQDPGALHIFAHVLLQTLLSLYSQYAQVRPARALAKQYAIDIVAVAAVARSCAQLVAAAPRVAERDVQERASLALSPLRGVLASIDGLCLKLVALYAHMRAPDAALLEHLQCAAVTRELPTLSAGADDPAFFASATGFRDLEAQLQRGAALAEQTISVVWRQEALRVAPGLFAPTQQYAAVGERGSLRLCVERVLQGEPTIDWTSLLAASRLVLNKTEVADFTARRPQLRVDDFPALNEAELAAAAVVRTALERLQATLVR